MKNKMKSSLNLKKPGFTLKNIETQPFLTGKISLADVSAAHGINAFHLMEFLVSTTINNGEQMCDNQDIWSRYAKEHNSKEGLVVPSYSLSQPGKACFFLYNHKEGLWVKNYFDRIEAFSSSIRVGYFTTPMSTN